MDPDQILLQKPSDLDPHHFQKACAVLMHAWLVKHAACLRKHAKRFEMLALSVRHATYLPKHPKRLQMHACAGLAHACASMPKVSKCMLGHALSVSTHMHAL